MDQQTKFATKHSEFIHDVAYDFYGKRLATCSSDHNIKIWDKNEDGKWECPPRNEINAKHNGSILRLSWAHPEFGNVLASCSVDKHVRIHEETIDPDKNMPVWKCPGTLSDSAGTVHAVGFAPRHHGLKLAAASQDGQLRVYESNDILNLGIWTLDAAFTADPSAKTKKVSVPCTCLAWNPSPFDGPMLAVGCGSTVFVWAFGSKSQKWVQVCELTGHGGDVLDVAWAPDMGRSHHFIATACKDKQVRVFRLSFDSSSEEPTSYTHTQEQLDQGEHEAEVWRVSWNITGTMLASTGDDGKCRLWKRAMSGEWRCLMVAAGKTSHQLPSQNQDDGKFQGLAAVGGSSHSSNLFQPPSSSSSSSFQPSQLYFGQSQQQKSTGYPHLNMSSSDGEQGIFSALQPQQQQYSSAGGGGMGQFGWHGMGSEDSDGYTD